MCVICSTLWRRMLNTFEETCKKAGCVPSLMCMYCVLGITNRQQWEEHISCQRERWGDTWYYTALNRGEWYKSCTEGATNYQSTHHKKQRSLELREVRCDDCRRTFRREADKARHKCSAERQMSVQDQQGAMQCV